MGSECSNHSDGAKKAMAVHLRAGCHMPTEHASNATEMRSVQSGLLQANAAVTKADMASLLMRSLLTHSWHGSAE